MHKIQPGQKAFRLCLVKIVFPESDDLEGSTQKISTIINASLLAFLTQSEIVLQKLS